jgi:hypothetical protein
MTGDATALPVTDDPGEGRLTVTRDGAEAELVYEVEDGRLLIFHTEVPDAFRGQGVGGRLVAAAADKARVEGLTVVPWCPYARKWLKEHPDAADGVTIDYTTPPPVP